MALSFSDDNLLRFKVATLAAKEKFRSLCVELGAAESIKKLVELWSTDTLTIVLLEKFLNVIAGWCSNVLRFSSFYALDGKLKRSCMLKKTNLDLFAALTLAGCSQLHRCM
jgi:hypothetical protein